MANVTDEIALYNPNGAAAIIAFVIFFGVAIGLWYRSFKDRPDAKYMRLVKWGCIFMAFGFICRFSRRNGIDAWSWLFETMFILLSPCAFIAQIYLLLPRLAEATGQDDCVPLSRRTLRWVFIPADVAMVLTQLAGTALTITFGDLVRIGRILVTAGLAVQLVFFTSFIVIYGVSVKRMRPLEKCVGAWYARWTTLLVMLGVFCCLMMVRSIYRVAEYGAG